MLHAFNVNRGSMMMFDVTLAMERLEALKSVLYEEQGIHPDKQVMLTSDGHALNTEDRVSSFSTGTETNPLYLFDKSAIERSDDVADVFSEQFRDFHDAVLEAINLQPTYNTVTERTKLALQMYESAKQQVHAMGALVHDEHFMYQGWQAAVRNLLETVSSFSNRLEIITQRCGDYIHRMEQYRNVFDGLDVSIEELSKIHLPHISNALSGVVESRQPETLLQWIEQNCNDTPLKKLSEDSQLKIMYLTTNKLNELINEGNSVLTQSNESRMCEITGLEERLAALNHVIRAADQQMQDMSGIVQGFVRNQDTARELQANAVSRDALLTICESHIGQLRIMQGCKTSLHVALKKCAHAKQELATNLHTRLRWVYYIERSILNVDVKLCMFHQHLSQMTDQLVFLEQVKQTPSLYIQSIVEAKRRHNFSHLYLQWSNRVISLSKMLCDEEVEKRIQFKPSLSHHFLRKLLRGFSGVPVSISTEQLPQFDHRLLVVTDDHLAALANVLPAYKEVLTQPAVSCDPSVLHHLSTGDGCRLTVSTTTHTITTTDVVAMPTSNSQDIASMSTSDGISSLTKSPPASVDPGGFVASSVYAVQSAVASEKTKTDNELQEQEKSLPQKQAIKEQISDIISPESPPDSEFFSIQPASVTFREYAEEKSFFHDSTKYYMDDEPKTKSSLLASSPDSTSFQKIEGITSSDEEMFHSFTSENGREIKLLRKRVNHLLAEVEKLEHEIEDEKDNSEKMIKKLTNELSNERQTRLTIEKDFEDRFDKTKAELNDVISQLENERVERKKAWQQETHLEDQLKVAQKKLDNETLKYEEIICENKQVLSDLQNNIQTLKDEHEEAIAVIHERHDHLLQEQSIKLSKKDKDNEFLQNDMKEAEDRIQELESSLSEVEQKAQFIRLENDKLNMQMNKTEESLLQTEQQNQHEHEKILHLEQERDEALKKMHEHEEKAKNLKLILADYEAKVEDSKVTMEQIMALQATLQRSQEDKSHLENLLNNHSLKQLKLENQNSSLIKEIESLKCTITVTQENHNLELNKLKSINREEIQEIIIKNETYIQQMEENQKTKIEELTLKIENEKELLRAKHMNQLDELEADRLQSIAQSQQSMEFWMTKEKDSSRNLELLRRERDNLLQTVEDLTAKCQDYERLKSVHENCIIAQQDLEADLSSARESLEHELAHHDNNANVMYSSSLSGTSEEETTTKRKLFNDIGMEYTSMGEGSSQDVISMQEHNEIVESMQRNFEHDKRAIQTMFEKRGQEMQRKNQLTFNAAIRKLQESKDSEIHKLKEEAVTRSMFVHPSSRQHEGSPIDIPPLGAAAMETSTDIAMTTSAMTDSVTSSTAPPSSSKPKESVVITNFQPGDLVLITYSSSYSSHTLFTSSKTLHFIHEDSLKLLGLKTESEVKRTTMLAVLVKMEYCLAKKAQNRFNVPINTKFYRVKVTPFIREHRKKPESS